MNRVSELQNKVDKLEQDLSYTYVALLQANAEIASLKEAALGDTAGCTLYVPWRTAGSRQEAHEIETRYRKAEADRCRRYGNDTP